MTDIRFNCPSCRQQIEAPAEMARELIDCPTCKATLEVPIRSLPVEDEVASSSPPLSNARWLFKPPQTHPSPQHAIKCQHCGAPMTKTKKVDKNLALQLLGVVLFLIGLVILFHFPVGTVAGLILMIGAARLGYKKVKIWKCEQCSYFFERAD